MKSGKHDGYFEWTLLWTNHLCQEDDPSWHVSQSQLLTSILEDWIGEN